jgi:hypothetical protein
LAMPIAQSAIEQAITQFSSPAQLQAKLLEVWTERDQLAQTLKIEQANHVQTRKNLTMALGDTMEILKARLRPDQPAEPDENAELGAIDEIAEEAPPTA